MQLSLATPFLARPFTVEESIAANAKCVWPNFLVWSPPWLYAYSVKNKNDISYPLLSKKSRLSTPFWAQPFTVEVSITANANGVCPNFLVWSPPWLFQILLMVKQSISL